jgi:hypothetical protein
VSKQCVVSSVSEVKSNYVSKRVLVSLKNVDLVEDILDFDSSLVDKSLTEMGQMVGAEGNLSMDGVDGVVEVCGRHINMHFEVINHRCDLVGKPNTRNSDNTLELTQHKWQETVSMGNKTNGEEVVERLEISFYEIIKILSQSRKA